MLWNILLKVNNINKHYHRLFGNKLRVRSVKKVLMCYFYDLRFTVLYVLFFLLLGFNILTSYFWKCTWQATMRNILIIMWCMRKCELCKNWWLRTRPFTIFCELGKIYNIPALIPSTSYLCFVFVGLDPHLTRSVTSTAHGSTVLWTARLVSFVWWCSWPQ